MFRIVCTEKPWKGRSLTVRQPAARLGARPDCDVALPPELLGGGTLVVCAELKGFRLIAEDGLELTVNRRPVGRETMVRAGEAVRAGRFAFTLRPLGLAATRRRRPGAMQVFAILGVLLVLLFEVGFLLYLSLLRDESQGVPLPEPVAPTPVAVEPPAPIAVEPPAPPAAEPATEPETAPVPELPPEPEAVPEPEATPEPTPPPKPEQPPELGPPPEDMPLEETDLP